MSYQNYFHVGSDDLDIRSLSILEAENIYHLPEEGNSHKKKDSVKLDSFHIIKVIGKGNRKSVVLLINSRVVLFLFFVVRLSNS